tara:strand:+ start:863 stop:1936 length:1074 start_codon:yes stop_codon:yes gene_type:complete
MIKHESKLEFGAKVMQWFEANKRDLPFRKDKDPYRVWLSEILLQQTQMGTGIKYYKKFIKKFPKIEKLAKAKEETIYSIWKGLGYYNRAKNLHKTAQEIVNNYQGVFPNDYNDLLSLPGIGKYTASAISSICFNSKRYVIDTNVYRVFSRYLGINKKINQSKSYKYFENLSKELAKNIKNTGAYNEAIMDFGSLICKPKNPKCDICIIRKTCFSYINNTQEKYPLKEVVKKRKVRYFNYFVIQNENYYLIQKRNNNDIWKNLFEFYLIEDKNIQNAKNVFQSTINLHKNVISHKETIQEVSQLSHLKIHVSFHGCFIKKKRDFSLIEKLFKLKKIKKQKTKNLGFPKVIDNYLKYKT